MSKFLNGWVRLWIVVTALWISSIAYLAYPSIAEVSDRVKYEIKRDGVGTFEATFSRGEPEDLRQREIAERLIPMFEANPAKYRGQVFDEPYTNFAKHARPDRISTALSLALLPPLAIFLLGWAFAWVRQGFARPAV
jgi:hypothetical protein